MFDQEEPGRAINDGEDPKGEDDPLGAPDCTQRLRFHRVADGDVAFCEVE